MTRPLRLATYNVAWFTELFDDDGNFANDHSESVRFNVTKSEQFAAIGAVMRHLNADAILVIEGPDQSDQRSAVRALEKFAKHFGLRASKALIGFTSHTRQEIVLMYDPSVITAAHDPMGTADKNSSAPRFDFDFSYDLDQDGVVENIGFSKPPLEVLLNVAGAGSLRLIGVHAKSKSPRNTRSRAEFVAQSIQNRRKQLAECFWLRGRVDEVLALKCPLIVLGDFNDGPGLDEYERLFGHSSVEVVMGAASPGSFQLFDPNAATVASTSHRPAPVTSRFYLPEKKGYFEALLDFIMVSESLAKLSPQLRIWHPLHDPAIIADPGLAQALLMASDHFPVTIDVNLPPNFGAA